MSFIVSHERNINVTLFDGTLLGAEAVMSEGSLQPIRLNVNLIVLITRLSWSGSAACVCSFLFGKHRVETPPRCIECILTMVCRCFFALLLV